MTDSDNILEIRGRRIGAGNGVTWQATNLSIGACLLPDRWFPDRTYPNHNNIPDHTIDVYIYPDLQLPRPVLLHLTEL